MNDIEFRPITSTGGKYKVSQAGQVYGPRGQLKPTLMKVGYYSVALSLDTICGNWFLAGLARFESFL